MDTELIIRPKVIVPGKRSNLISRKRLLTLLSDLLDYKLILVIAPGGYGKTSLLIDYAAQSEMPFCWFTVDHLDQDLRRFLIHFTASIAYRFPQFETTLNAFLQMANIRDLEAVPMARFLANAIFENIDEHFVIVLDDFHQVTENLEIIEFVSLIIQQVSDNAHFVILSRSLLQLPDLPLMVSRSQAVGLGTRELMFQPEEIQTLMYHNYHIMLSDDQAQKLFEDSEGWITSLLMSSQVTTGRMEDWLHSASISGVGLYDYLAEQVFAKQSPTIQNFLLRTSVFDEFNAELCFDVLGPPPDGTNWDELIRTVIRENLLVLQIGEEENWIRYHHLFKDFLQTRLSQEQPEEEGNLWSQYAKVSVERGDFERAYAIYQRLGNHSDIAELLENIGPKMLWRGQIGTLNRWLNQLSPDLIPAHPFLLALRSICGAVLGKPKHALNLINQAIEFLKEDPRNPSFLVPALTWRAFIHFLLANYQQSLKDSEVAFSLCKESSELSRWQAELSRIRGLNFRLMGNIEQSIQSFTESLSSFEAVGDMQSVARLSVGLGAAYLDGGAYGRAMSYYKTAIEYYRNTQNLFALPSALNDLGFLHYLRGEYEEAATLLEEAINKAQQTGNLRTEALALASFGDLCKDIGATQDANQTYEQSYQIFLTLDDQFMLLYLNLARAALSREEGDYVSSISYLASAESHVNKSSSAYERGLFTAEAGRLALATGDNLKAVELLKTAVNIFEEGGQKNEVCKALVSLGQASYEAGKKELTYAHLRHLFQISTQLENQHIVVLASRGAKTIFELALDAPDIHYSAQRILLSLVNLDERIAKVRHHLRLKVTDLPLSSPKINIQALGVTRVTIDNKLVTSTDWQTQKTRDLFYLLLNTPGGMTKEVLGEILWPDSSPEQLKSRFKNTIYRLRRAFEMDVVLLVNERYIINRNLDYEYDVETFWSLVRRAPTEQNTDEQIRSYQQAVQLYKGTFLPDIQDTWVIPERERLWQTYVDIKLILIEHHLRKGDHRRAVEMSQELLTEDPCLEEAHRKLMIAYAEIGNRVAVSRQYEQCQIALMRELSLSPSEQTVRLYQSLIS